eukprot:scaffold2875_cov247-Pinguiococcus_pyrenoidosus.AAC.10
MCIALLDTGACFGSCCPRTPRTENAPGAFVVGGRAEQRAVPCAARHEGWRGVLRTRRLRLYLPTCGRESGLRNRTEVGANMEKLLRSAPSEDAPPRSREKEIEEEERLNLITQLYCVARRCAEIRTQRNR